MRRIISIWFVILSQRVFSTQGLALNDIVVTVLHDNYPFQQDLQTDWGFACLVEGLEKTILFDTGTKGDILLRNAGILGLDLNKVDCVVLSRDHRDHYGALTASHGKSWRYLGQEPPGDQARLFAPEIMKHRVHSAPTFSSDGREMFWSTVCEDEGARRIVKMKYEEGKWLGPMKVPFASEEPEDQPFLSYDGSRMVYASKRPSLEGGISLWSVTRRDDVWGEPEQMGMPISTESGQWTPSLMRDGSLCFTAQMGGMRNGFGIFLSPFVNGQYQRPFALPETINRRGPQNWTPWIAPDGSFILFASGRQPKEGSHDIFVSYRDGDSWTEPMNLGTKVNTARQERFPGLSPDGKYLFFTRHYEAPCYHDLYWIEAKVVLPHL